MSHKDRPALLGGTPMSDRVIPVSKPTLPKFETLAERYAGVFASGMITNSKYVEAYEQKLRTYLGVNHVVATANCTSGLLLALKCLKLEGEVILPSFTFSVTGHVVEWNHLTPVFVDVEPDTCCIDPRQVEAAITPRTSAIIGVHIWGNPCNVEALQQIATKHGLRLIYDSAQALGSRVDGQYVGNFGHAEVFSTSPTKLLSTGEGGLLSTCDAELAKQVRIGRNYGDDGSYDCHFAGINARMSELHALLGLESVDRIETNIARRESAVARYKARLGQLPGIRFQTIRANARSNWVYFSIIVDEEALGLGRDHLYTALAQENIQARKYYHPPLHQQSVNRRLRAQYAGRLPVSERLSQHALTLPLFSHISDEEVDLVCTAVERIVTHADQIKAEIAS